MKVSDQNNNQKANHIKLLSAGLISVNHEESFKKTFQDLGNYEFTEFILSRDTRLKYPTQIQGVLINYALTPEVLEYFLLKRSHLIKRSSAEDIRSLITLHREMYLDHPSLMRILDKLEMVNQKLRPYRTSVHIFSRLVVKENKVLSGVVKDISSRGAFVLIFDCKNFAVGQTIQLQFEFLDKQWILKGKIRWISMPGASRLGAGIGISWNEVVEEFDLNVVKQKVAV